MLPPEFVLGFTPSASVVIRVPPCLIGIEACTGAHYWGRFFEQMGHTVKMMAPQFVKPYIKSNKNDSNDARGIAEAVTRPDMKFVAIKRVEQQDVLLLHRARELVIKQRTAQANQIRGLLSEYGIIITQGITNIEKLPEILENNENKLTPTSKNVFLRLHEQFRIYDEQVATYDREIECIAKQDVRCR
jgi:transposase